MPQAAIAILDQEEWERAQEAAFGPQQEWESPRQERQWLGHKAASLIPDGASEDQVIEALQLWAMPAEAWSTCTC